MTPNRDKLINAEIGDTFLYSTKNWMVKIANLSEDSEDLVYFPDKKIKGFYHYNSESVDASIGVSGNDCYTVEKIETPKQVLKFLKAKGIRIKDTKTKKCKICKRQI